MKTHIHKGKKKGKKKQLPQQLVNSLTDVENVNQEEVKLKFVSYRHSRRYITSLCMTEYGSPVVLHQVFISSIRIARFV